MLSYSYETDTSNLCYGHCRIANDLESQPATKSDIQQLDKKMDMVAIQVARNCEDISTIKGDIGSIKGEIGTIQGDIRTINGDIGTTKGEMGTLKEEVSSNTQALIKIETSMSELVAVLKEGQGPQIKSNTQKIDLHEKQLNAHDSRIRVRENKID